jgi:hypothetical protein
MKRFVFLSVFLVVVSGIIAQNQEAKPDSLTNVRSKKEEKGRNVMLNASDNSGPRDINIGLPALNTGMPIRENNLLVSFTWPEMPRNNWRPGVGSAKVGLLSLAENTITFGSFGYSLNAESRVGSEKFDLRGSVSTSTFGWLRNDISISAPIGNNWSFIVAAYNDADPGSAELAFSKYLSRTSLYRLGLTKRFKNNKGKISFLYKYSKAAAFTDYAISVFQKGGEVKELDNIRMGKDSYVLNTGRVRFLDALSGNYYYADLGTDDLASEAHAFYIVGDNKLKNNWTLDYTLNYRYAETSPFALNYQAIKSVTQADGLTYMDGTPYEGEVQVVLASHDNKTPIHALQARIELGKLTQKHNLRLGLMNVYHKREKYAYNRSFFYQEVAADPRQLMNPSTATNSLAKTDEYGFYNYNRNTIYNNGHENVLTGYYIDDYKLTPRLQATYGFNVRYQKIKGDFSPTKRFNGFTLADAEFSEFDHNYFNYTANLNLAYNLTKYFGVNGQILYTTENGTLKDYALTKAPDLDTKIKTPYYSLGVFLNHPKLSIVSAFTYVTKNKFKKNLNLVNPNDPTETNSQQVFYDIKTKAWVNDIIAKPTKNFNLHYRLTLQDPSYDSYKFTAFGNDYDYSGNNVVKISKVLMEIDPKYTFLKKKMTVWASARYFSKQYANITNVLFFKGWWETFAGVKYKMNKSLAMDVKVINLLNQRGAKKEISGAELATDATPYYGNYVVSSYIRPFTVEASLKFKF